MKKLATLILSVKEDFDSQYDKIIDGKRRAYYPLMSEIIQKHCVSCPEYITPLGAMFIGGCETSAKWARDMLKTNPEDLHNPTEVPDGKIPVNMRILTNREFAMQNPSKKGNLNIFGWDYRGILVNGFYILEPGKTYFTDMSPEEFTNFYEN